MSTMHCTKTEYLGLSADRLYNRYNSLEQKLDKYKSAGFLGKHVLSLPCRATISYLRKKVIGIYGSCDMPLRELDSDSDVVVSLTSFPPRIDSLFLTIRSLFRQTVMPGKIVLWLSAEEFPKLAAGLPDTLTELMRRGLDVRFMPGNIRSHKKYFYAFQEFPNSRIVTVDDDVIYHPSTLERLLLLNAKFRRCVCANVFRHMTLEDGGFAPYKKWKKFVSGEFASSCLNTAIGCGGVLYPPNCFDKRVFDISAISECCPFADDLWLKANELLCGVDVAGGGEYFARPIELPVSRTHGLQRRNNGHVNMNDSQWEKLCLRFGLFDVLMSKCR